MIPRFNANKDKTNRPVIKPEMLPADWLIEIIALGGMAFLFGYAIYWYSKLPETIPSHFDFKGNVDSYGSKGTIFMLPIIGLFVYGLLTVLVLVPHTFNYPWKITPENALRQYTLACRLLRSIKVAIVFIFSYITVDIVVSAQNAHMGLGFILVPIISGLVFIPIVIYLIVAGNQK